MTTALQRRIWLCCILVLVLSSFRFSLWAMGKPWFWELSIRRFERSDSMSPPRPGVIVFTGSSSINFWSSLADDMKPLDVINRGFGGSQIAEVNYFAPRIILPYRPSAVVLYCGDNDLSWPWSKSPDTILDDFKQFVAIIHAQLPETWIYYLSIKPTTLRSRDWPTMQKTNEMTAAFIRTQDRVQFVDVSSAMLDSQGQPRRDLLKWDGLHPNPKCYALWTSILKPILLARFGPGE